MSQNEDHLNQSLVAAVSKTLENMAFEQVELIEGSLEEYMAARDASLEQALSAIDGERSDIEEPEPAMETAADNDSTEAILPEDAVEEDLWASIPLLKPFHGELILVFPSVYAGQLTESIYGGLTVVDSKEVSVNDAIAEVINIIAGCFVQELIPSDKRFELGLPNTGWGEIPSAENIITELNFDLGGHVLRAIVAGQDFRNYINENIKIQEKVS